MLDESLLKKTKHTHTFERTQWNVVGLVPTNTSGNNIKEIETIYYIKQLYL
jgi:hypothetical protein